MTTNNSPSGWLVIDKPADLSSAKALITIKKAFPKIKIGHSGTLDPFATGVLPVAIGEATKVISYNQADEKEYIFKMQLGKETDTLDTEGSVIHHSDIIPSEEELKNVISLFIGITEQTPPPFSALKVNGKRAYQLARDGAVFTLQPRKITIHQLKLLDFSREDATATFKVRCGKGTYIRSLARDIARKLNSYGYLLELRRTKVGIFSEDMLISLDKFKEIVHNGSLEREMKSVDIVLDDIPVLYVSKENEAFVKQGRQIHVDIETAELLSLKNDDKLVAIGYVIDHYFQPTRVFNL